jgi:hypothetical protein
MLAAVNLYCIGLKTNALTSTFIVLQMAAESEEAEREDTSRRGFDRLRDRLSREEIQALRLYFYPQLSLYISQAERIPGESSEDRIYRLEEEWMDAQGPQSEFCT